MDFQTHCQGEKAKKKKLSLFKHPWDHLHEDMYSNFIDIILQSQHELWKKWC